MVGREGRVHCLVLVMEITPQNSGTNEAGGVWRRWLPRFRRSEMWSYFGPAFVASIAYIDPGNFATNIVGGADFGYSLLWVLLWSNAMAILIQFLSAKLGIATGHTLPQNCRLHFSKKANLGRWVSISFSTSTCCWHR